MASSSQRLVASVGGGVFATWVVSSLMILRVFRRSPPPPKAVVRRRPAGGKLAFMFLVRTKIPTTPIWEAFFSEASEEAYAIYTHPRPGRRLEGIFAGTEIANRTRVAWGAITVARAEMLLVRAAMQDPRNERFLLLSESCVPLHPFWCVYAFATSAPSFVATWPTSDRKNLYDFGTLDVVVKKHWRKGHQWVLLSRRHAALLSDAWYDAFAAAHAATAVAAEFRRELARRHPHLRGDDIHHNFADEHFVQTILAVDGLESDVVAASPAYVRFGSADSHDLGIRRRRLLELDIHQRMKSDWHATIYRARHLTPALFARARAMCDYDLTSPRVSSDDDPRRVLPRVAPWDPTHPRNPDCLFRGSSQPSLCHLTMRKIPDDDATVTAYRNALWPAPRY
ncbi:hypothetical protein CTAYLR_007121 [Chrysophaeum taylorii]|uniref:Uncharacterized protein n=1 Tax=Chrysophaeum taylorii TaxID=2483200 RepID=A0AAD7U7H2_9STRA|nr:hypothetical protein CTAYLR_007121 [Chrysophaeum taylorii]